MRTLVIGVAMLALAAPAEAATVSRQGSAILFQAAPREVNNAQGQVVNGRYLVMDPNVAVAAGAGCAPETQLGNFIACDGAGVVSVVFALGDGNDSSPGFGALPPGVRFRSDGGAGNDSLYAKVGRSTLVGGAGRDNLYGSPGADTLIGGAAGDTLAGRGGRDRLDGGAGDDHLQGQGRLTGGAGKDYLVTFFEGSRRSIVSRLFGGTGSDHFLTGNRAKDIVDCGRGADFVTTTIDPLHSDRRRDRFARSCERSNIF